MAPTNRALSTQFSNTSVVLLVAAGDGAIKYLPPTDFAPSIKYTWELNSIPKILDNYNILAIDVYYIAQYSVLLLRQGLESADHASSFQFGTLAWAWTRRILKSTPEASPQRPLWQKPHEIGRLVSALRLSLSN